MILLRNLLLAATFSLAHPAMAEQPTRLTALDQRADVLGLEAIGRLDSPHGYCSGTLIAPDLVLTAAHCVFHSETGQAYEADDLTFRAALSGSNALAERRALRIAVDPKYDPSGPLSYERVAADVALVLLNDPIPTTVAAPFALHSGTALDGPVSVVSYGRGRTDHMSWQKACNIVARNQGVFVMDCNVTYGSSGSAVFAREHGRYRIVSLNSAIGTFRGKKAAFGMELKHKVAALKRTIRSTPVQRKTSAKRLTVGSDGARNSGQARFVKVNK